MPCSQSIFANERVSALLNSAQKVGRQIDVAKLRRLAQEFELTMDVDMLHREADLDKSGV